jgi:hypothetical protein
MSKVQELRDRYEGYVAAQKAVEKTRPNRATVQIKRIPYLEDNDRIGEVIYSPEHDTICIDIQNCNKSIIRAKDVPFLISALKELTE